MNIKINAIVLLACLATLIGCQTDRNYDTSSTEELTESIQELPPSSITEPESEPTPEQTVDLNIASQPESEAGAAFDAYKPNELLDWQEDPTLTDSHWIDWDHLEYRVFGAFEEYVPCQYQMYRVDKLFSTNKEYKDDVLSITFLLPPNVKKEGVLEFYNGFQGGPIKIGEVGGSYYQLVDGESPFDIISGLKANRDVPEPDYEVIESKDNVVGGFYQTDRFIRSITPSSRSIVPDITEVATNHVVSYNILLEDMIFFSAYFFVSAQATAEDLEVYDAIINSMEIIY